MARSSQAGRTIRPRTRRRRVAILALPPEAASLVCVVVLGVSSPRCQAPGWCGAGARLDVGNCACSRDGTKGHSGVSVAFVGFL